MADAVAVAFCRFTRRRFDEPGYWFQAASSGSISRSPRSSDVATAAGVPAPIVDRARNLLEEGAESVSAARISNGGTGQQGADAGQETAMSADGGDDATDIAAELRALEVAHLTPVEALTELDRLKRALERDDD